MVFGPSTRPSAAQEAWEGPSGRDWFKRLVSESGSDHCIDEQGWRAFAQSLTVGAGVLTEEELLESIKATAEATAQRYIQAQKRNDRYHAVAHGAVPALNPIPMQSGRGGGGSDSLPLGASTMSQAGGYTEFRLSQIQHRRY